MMSHGVSKLAFFCKRKFKSLAFVLRHPQFFGTDFINPSCVRVGQMCRFSAGSRLYAFDATSRIEIKDRVWAGRNVDIHVRKQEAASIGLNASLQDGCKIIGDVKIGAYSILAPNVFMSSGSHVFGHSPRDLIRFQDMKFPATSKKIEIGEDVWIGINTAIMPGVTVGRGAVIGANSVVTKNVPAYTVWAGVPAKEVSKRLHFVPKTSLKAADPDDRVYFYEGFDHVAVHPQGMKIIAQSARLVLKGSQSKHLRIEVWSSSKSEQSIEITVHGFANRCSVKPGNNQLAIETVPSEDESYITLNSENGEFYVKSAGFAD